MLASLYTVGNEPTDSQLGNLISREESFLKHKKQSPEAKREITDHIKVSLKSVSAHSTTKSKDDRAVWGTLLQMHV